jgi:two-component system cell cycle sensor histidine kinase/response regulator CckA
VNADPTQITQVLMNLVLNAKHAMPHGGRVLIRTVDINLDGYPPREGSHFVDPGERPLPGPYVSLSVADEGVGMDEQTVSHIFEPFFTTKGIGEGTGLGLATVFGIVKQSKGHITVQSAPGQGSTFDIFLPRADGLPEPASEAGPRELAGNETILVIEDEPEVLAFVKTALRQFGYDALGATGPEEGLALLRDHPGKIDLLIIDVVMPGMTARQLAEEMERIRPGIRILLMSGYTESEIFKEGLLDEGLLFVQKPFTAEELAQKVREALS